MVSKNKKKRKTISATPEQIAAALNATKYSHTSVADDKRRKTIVARKENKVFGLV